MSFLTNNLVSSAIREALTQVRASILAKTASRLVKITVLKRLMALEDLIGTVACSLKHTSFPSVFPAMP